MTILDDPSAAPARARAAARDLPSLSSALDHWAAATPAAPFVTDLADGRRLSYEEFAASVRGCRRLLGSEPRAIAAVVPSSASMAVMWLAAVTGGHRFAPLSTESTDDEKARLAERLEPDVIFVESAEDATGFRRPGALVLTVDQMLSAIDTWSTEAPFAESKLPPTPRAEGELWLTTSGTTGEPKGVVLTESRLAWTADHIREAHRLTPSDRGLSVLPFFHVNAPVVSLCASLMAGASLAIAPRFSKTHFWSWIHQERITWASVVPTIVAMLLQTERADWLPGSLRFVRSASAPLPVVQLLAFERRFGVPAIETYGLSEAASTVAANPVPPEAHRPGSVGLPVGVEIRVCAPRDGSAGAALRDVPRGSEGEICVRGTSVIDGYQGGRGRESFQDGWFRTGDLGYQDEDGYLFITGRLRDLINRSGHKISPREIEEVLLQHPGVSDAAVVGEADPIYGEVPIAYVVPSQDVAPLPAELASFTAEHLSRYKVPAQFQVVAALPRTRTGKVERGRLSELREPVAALQRRSA